MKYIIDIDGTLLDGSNPVQYSREFIHTLQETGESFLLMTNSIKSKKIQLERLAHAGFALSSDSILNPIVAINEYIKQKKIENVKVIGTAEEINQIEANHVMSSYELVVLLDFEKSNAGYTVLQDIVNDIEAGKRVVTASVSRYYLKNGRKAIDTGSFVRLVEEITNTKIMNFGKPSNAYFTIAAKKLNEKPENIYIIGDDWRTDIVGANEFGAKSILVTSGKYETGDEHNGAPYRLVNTLAEL